MDDTLTLHSLIHQIVLKNVEWPGSFEAGKSFTASVYVNKHVQRSYCPTY